MRRGKASFTRESRWSRCSAQLTNLLEFALANLLKKYLL
jgi:hypothetical protein